ncbi:uncharacterized protein LOC115917962 [Strongylocentrotus purpuratus]|uniref:Uncharacterized protein n=1 Tax=Strongylocentrotus purpuratus TaxID=7668 RepID=A0A7M7HHT0_STRPU|nr:uncharacterized protein LOC115917962 [Strongylocentrotus purpuratus]
MGILFEHLSSKKWIQSTLWPQYIDVKPCRKCYSLSTLWMFPTSLRISSLLKQLKPLSNSLRLCFLDLKAKHNARDSTQKLTHESKLKRNISKSMAPLIRLNSLRLCSLDLKAVHNARDSTQKLTHESKLKRNMSKITCRSTLTR